MSTSDHQFERLLRNAAPVRPELAFAGTTQVLLRKAARQLQQRDQAERAWSRVADPSWGEAVRVVGYADDVLTVVVADAHLRGLIRSARARLLRGLRAYVPRLRSVHVTSGAATGDDLA